MDHRYEVAVRSQVLPDRGQGLAKMRLIAGNEMDAESFGEVRTPFPTFMSLFGCKHRTSVSLEPKRGDACWVFTWTRACRHVFWCWSVHKCGLSEVHSFLCTVVKVTGKDKRKNKSLTLSGCFRHKVWGTLFSEQVTKMDKREAKLWERPMVDPVCRYSR